MLRSLASPLRLRILQLLKSQGELHMNDVSRLLGLPQSTTASNIQLLEPAGLVRTETRKANKGQQKICMACFDEVVIRLDGDVLAETRDVIEVAMPLGLYTGSQVTTPCGLCSTKGVIGLLGAPHSFLDPRRMQAALLWFGCGHVEYKVTEQRQDCRRGDPSSRVQPRGSCPKCQARTRTGRPTSRSG